MTPKVGEIYKDDVEQLYHVIEVFERSCIVEPLVNEDCFSSEIMSFKAMQQEGWVRIGYTDIYNQDAHQRQQAVAEFAREVVAKAKIGDELGETEVVDIADIRTLAEQRGINL